MALTLQPGCPMQPWSFRASDLCKSCAHSYICSQMQIISQISSAIIAYLNNIMSSSHQAFSLLLLTARFNTCPHAWPALRMNRLNLGDKD